MRNGDVVNLGSHQLRIVVKNSDQLKAAFLKIGMICKGMTQVARADNNGFVSARKPQNLSDFVIEILNLIAVALLSEAAEAVQILPDLRRRNTHFFTQMFG